MISRLFMGTPGLPKGIVRQEACLDVTVMTEREKKKGLETGGKLGGIAETSLAMS
jgi:hypothetical protein